MYVIEKILLLMAAATIANGVLAAGGPGSQGNGNSNAQSLSDSNRGLDRARERKSEQGLEHSKAATKTKTNRATVKKLEILASPEPPKPPRIP